MSSDFGAQIAKVTACRFNHSSNECAVNTEIHSHLLNKRTVTKKRTRLITIIPSNSVIKNCSVFAVEL